MPSSRVQCQISPMAQDRQKISDTLPRRGRVTEVCKEWLVREDGALAYELQKEEVERHYSSNKSRNAIVREDFPMAVDAQRQAEEEAMAEYQRQALLAEEKDALIARDIALQLEREENEKRKRLEEQDQRMAKIIQDKEQRQKVRTLADINRVGLPLCPGVDVPPSTAHKVEKVNSIEQQMRQLHVRDSDQSDNTFWPPPPDMDQINKIQQEKSDEELAKRLQEEEEDLTRTNGMIDRDRLLAIEVQDMELAKMMQAKERAKAKRARERARARKQMEEEMNQNAERNMEPENVAPETYRVPNIAMAIDPTYSPKNQPSAHTVVQHSPQHTLMQHSPQHTLMQHSPQHTLIQHSPQHTLVRHRGDCDIEVDEEALPYMPIQGQRRVSSGGTDKKKKKDKSREECKQQ